MQRDPQYLRDILDSANRIMGYAHGLNREQFLRDIQKQDAVIRRLEIMGEAAKRLSKTTLAAMPTIDWKHMKGMRDVLIHDYDDIEAERLWDTIEVFLPSLVTVVKQYLDDCK